MRNENTMDSVLFRISSQDVHHIESSRKERKSTDHGDSKPTAKNCEKHSTLRDYAKAVDHMNCDDDDIGWSEFKSSSVYNANDEQQDCLRAE